MTQRGESSSPVRGWEADSALTVLYAAHWQSLVRLSWLLVRDQQVAEATVLRHRTVGNRYLKAETSARTAFGTTTEPSAETRALEHATGDRLVAALGRLPRRQREVLTLRYYLDRGPRCSLRWRLRLPDVRGQHAGRQGHRRGDVKALYSQVVSQAELWTGSTPATGCTHHCDCCRSGAG